MLKMFYLGFVLIYHRVPRITFLGFGRMLYFSASCDFGLFMEEAKLKSFFDDVRIKAA